MAFATLHFHSPALAKACSMNVIVPEHGVGQPPFLVCYLLHGLSDDHTTWARRTSIERNARSSSAAPSPTPRRLMSGGGSSAPRSRRRCAASLALRRAEAPTDPYALAATIDRRLLPALRLDCGLEDGLLEENRAFHRHLEQLGIPHEYAEFPGAHTWDYWDCHVQEAIAFHRRALGLSG
jgi:S-formylglutathione hydrolase FrmB